MKQQKSTTSSVRRLLLSAGLMLGVWCSLPAPSFAYDMPKDIYNYNWCSMTSCMRPVEIPAPCDIRCIRRLCIYKCFLINTCTTFSPVYLPTGYSVDQPESVYGGYGYNGWAVDNLVFGNWYDGAFDSWEVIKKFMYVPVVSSWSPTGDPPEWPKERYQASRIIGESRRRWPPITGPTAESSPTDSAESPLTSPLEDLWSFSRWKGHMYIYEYCGDTAVSGSGAADDYTHCIQLDGSGLPHDSRDFPWKTIPRKAESHGKTRIDDRIYFSSWLFFLRMDKQELTDLGITGGEHQVSLSPFANYCVPSDDRTYSLLNQSGAFEAFYQTGTEYMSKYNLAYWMGVPIGAELALHDPSCSPIIPYADRPMYWIYVPYTGCAIYLPLFIITDPVFGEPY